MKLTTASQMRELDRRAIEEEGIPSIDLMDRAAEGVAQAVGQLLPLPLRRGKVAVVCGTGNNGGDGIAAACLLAGKGVSVRVFLVGAEEKMTPDAREEARRLLECGVSLEAFDSEDTAQRSWVLGCQVLVDALFGVGLSRPVEEESAYGRAIALINRAPAAVVAVDIPSGIDADTGRVMGRAVKATCTITFTGMKIGHAVAEGALYSGVVRVWDIGIPQKAHRGLLCPVQTVEEDFARWALPRRAEDGHKGTFGKVLVLGGSRGYTGAPYLAALGAARSGCGLVFLGVPEGIWAIEAAKCDGAMPFPLPGKEDAGRVDETALPALLEKMEICDVLALGPGLGRDASTDWLIREVLRQVEKPVVLDADGINALEGHIDVLDGRKGRITIVTPHEGEFARMGGDLTGGDRVGAARAFAADHGCYLVLKGHRTLTAAPEGNVLVNTTGGSGLAKGGSGDVLTGVIASLLAQGAPAVQAAALGVWLHGRAGDLAAQRLTAYGMTPKDTADALAAAIGEIV